MLIGGFFGFILWAIYLIYYVLVCNHLKKEMDCTFLLIRFIYVLSVCSIFGLICETLLI